LGQEADWQMQSEQHANSGRGHKVAGWAARDAKRFLIMFAVIVGSNGPELAAGGVTA
jgi:hypothetical protein